MADMEEGMNFTAALNQQENVQNGQNAQPMVPADEAFVIKQPDKMNPGNMMPQAESQSSEMVPNIQEHNSVPNIQQETQPAMQPVLDEQSTQPMVESQHQEFHAVPSSLPEPSFAASSEPMAFANQPEQTSGAPAEMVADDNSLPAENNMNLATDLPQVDGQRIAEQNNISEPFELSSNDFSLQPTMATEISGSPTIEEKPLELARDPIPAVSPKQEMEIAPSSANNADLSHNSEIPGPMPSTVSQSPNVQAAGGDIGQLKMLLQDASQAAATLQEKLNAVGKAVDQINKGPEQLR